MSNGSRSVYGCRNPGKLGCVLLLSVCCLSITVKGHGTELIMAGIIAPGWSTSAISWIEGRRPEKSVYYGMAQGGCVIWATPGTLHLARTWIAHCVRSYAIRLMLPRLRRTRVGRGSELGYTLHPGPPSRSSKITGSWGAELEVSFQGQRLLNKLLLLGLQCDAPQQRRGGCGVRNIL
jgi:hypothetical protein